VAPPARIVHDMTSEQHGPLDAAHLDDDAEALEDPVHCGDAKHQHDLHEKAHAPAATDPVQRD
jgi:hypothetical protein